VLSENLIVPFRGTKFPVGKFKFPKEFFDPASGKRIASQTATKAAPLAFMSKETLRTRSLQRRYLIRKKMKGKIINIEYPARYDAEIGCEALGINWNTFDGCQIRKNRTRYVSDAIIFDICHGATWTWLPEP